MPLKRLVGSSRKPIIVHFNANTRAIKPQRGYLRRKIIHRVTLGGLYIVIRIADNIAFGHEDCAQGAAAILRAAKPNRIAMQA